MCIRSIAFEGSHSNQWYIFYLIVALWKSLLKNTSSKKDFLGEDNSIDFQRYFSIQCDLLLAGTEDKWDGMFL